MNETIAGAGDHVIAIHSDHALLHGRLTLPAQWSALVVLTRAGDHPAARDDALAVVLQYAGFATLVLDLLMPAEERFADLRHNVPRLARRLLDGLALIRQGMLLGELPTLPIGLCAADDCSPVALRVAAQRDRDIYAVVCRGGLIDRAGSVCLRSLRAPLLVLVGADDERLGASNRRALRELACAQEMKLLPADAHSPGATAAFECIARETAHWFVRQLPKAAATA